jgi:hypothetical protein
VIALLLAALAALVLIVELVRHHTPTEAALLVGVLVPVDGAWLTATALALVSVW